MDNIWHATIGIYIAFIVLSFLPALKALLAKVEKSAIKKSVDTAHAAFDSAPQFNDTQRDRLKTHYERLAGTLVFWKIHARKYKLTHFYCLLWAIPSAVLIPVLTQAISADNLSKEFVTLVSAFTAVLLALHRGFKIEDNYKAFRHGESEYYDLYRRLLDSTLLKDQEVNEAITEYIAETETIRRFVRNAETSNLPTLDEAKNILQEKTQLLPKDPKGD